MLPATTDVFMTRDFLGLEERANAQAIQRITASHLTFKEAAHRMIDLIGYHELGDI